MSTTELTILMPCLNEAETLAACIVKAKKFLDRSGISGEIIIADNGSIDGSQAIARELGARVVPIAERGYGAALIGGVAAANGQYVVMGDSDDSYDFEHLDRFVEELRRGADLVMGNRFMGGIKRGAMPLLHRYLGNPVLSMVGRILFASPCGDFHCGLRAFRRDSILRLGLCTAGMEFASEMVVKASVDRLRIVEVPTTLSPDGRSRPPHLRSWRDGWRHLKFMLLYSPRGLFFYPGLTMFLLGLLGSFALLPGPLIIGRVSFDIATLLYSSVLVVVGLQSMLFWALAKIIAMREGIVPPDPWFRSLISGLYPDTLLIMAGFILLLGLVLGVTAVGIWHSASFGPLLPDVAMRLAIPSATMILVAFQVAFAGLFAGFLDIRRATPGLS